MSVSGEGKSRNEEQRAQSWSPDSYQKNAAFVAQLGEPVIELLSPVAGEHVLDLGCGDGVLTRKLSEIGCDVLGVDASTEQVAGAKALGLQAQVMSGEALRFDKEFDAVFSNAALHWMKDADAVIGGVKRALRPGGRFVGEFGGAGNVAAIQAALSDELAERDIDATDLNPWYFPTPADYRQRLEGEGFIIDHMELFSRPTPLPGDVTGWLHTFAESFLSAVPLSDQTAFLDAVRARLQPIIQNEDGVWVADYVRLRFAAHLPDRE